VDFPAADRVAAVAAVEAAAGDENMFNKSGQIGRFFQYGTKLWITSGAMASISHYFVDGEVLTHVAQWNKIGTEYKKVGESGKSAYLAQKVREEGHLRGKPRISEIFPRRAG